MSSFLTLDIETVAQARFLDPERYAAAEFSLEEEWYAEHHSDADDVCIAIEEGQAPLQATKCVPALHATTCHIVQVSFGWRAQMGNHTDELLRRVLQSNQWQDLTLAPDLNGLGLAAGVERHLVSTALDMLAGACQKRSTIVTFNGKQFDIPLLRARAALLGLVQRQRVIPWRRLIYPYADDHHADLRLILSADDRRARGTLQWWADAFGIHAEEHGAEVHAWVQAGEWEKLRAYGETEAKTLVELYEAVEPVL